MDAVLRGLAIYAALLIIFRISGKRTLAQITTFDFVLLLIVSEATQQGLLGDDFSVTNAIVVVATLVSADILMSLVKERSPGFTKLADGVPIVILENGKPIDDRMKRSRVDVSDILASGRESQGIERLDQIKYAVLEQGGSISVIPHRRD
jgi:uncharacterized membrane protein YcaP (DUF421 family)